MQAQPVFFAGGSGKNDGAGELTPRFIGVKPQEVDCFAQFQNGIHQCLASFTLTQAEEIVGVLFEQVCCRFEQDGALFTAEPVPPRLDRLGTRDCLFHFEVERVAPCSDFRSQIVRLVDGRDFRLGP